MDVGYKLPGAMICFAYFFVIGEPYGEFLPTTIGVGVISLNL